MEIIFGLIGIGLGIFGVMNHLKGKRILAAPFKKTGELAANPTTSDPKGAISTEGKVVAPADTVLSPCSKTPCLYYEVKIERLYEKTETTQEGTKTTKGSSTLDTLKGGAVAGLDDGSGVFQVDFSKGADFDKLKEGFKKELNGRGWASNIQFGELSFDIPVISSNDGYTIGFKATERFVPVEGSLFVLGKLDGGKIVKPSWRSMLASAKGREGLMGSVTTKKKVGFIGGGVGTVLAIVFAIFGPKADPNAKHEPSAYCESSLTDARQQCSNTVRDEAGDTISWAVTQPGKYDLIVSIPKKKYTMSPTITLTDSKGEEVIGDEDVKNAPSAEFESAHILHVDVKAGAHHILIKPDWMLKGGFSYSFEIKSLNPVAKPKFVAVVAAKGDDEAPVADAAYADEKLASRVAELNELCGDTFCEGEFNYTFTKLACDDATKCQLSFNATNSKKKAYSATVAINGFTELSPNPDAEFKYVGSFDEAVGNALQKWEAKPMNTKAPVAAKPVIAVKPVAKPAPVAKAAPVVAAKPVAKAAPAPRSVAAPVAPPAPRVVAAAPAPVAPAPVVHTAKAAPSAPVAKRSNKNLED